MENKDMSNITRKETEEINKTLEKKERENKKDFVLFILNRLNVKNPEIEDVILSYLKMDKCDEIFITGDKYNFRFSNWHYYKIEDIRESKLDSIFYCEHGINIEWSDDEKIMELKNKIINIPNWFVRIGNFIILINTPSEQIAKIFKKSFVDDLKKLNDQKEKVKEEIMEQQDIISRNADLVEKLKKQEKIEDLKKELAELEQ
jgi:hypothetical protein